jgi:phosphatidylinositol glycan class N
VYFQSPLVFGLAPYRGMPQEAPAKRLVLFVADGLRADKFYERNMETKFLRTQIETKGAWGVSHTRVPTESRPGHVAMIAGFYEDVSAVTKGWKDNPVEFDSLFNRSRESWAWGSPDILPMFSSRTDHMTSDCYPPEFEDFGAGSAVHLDTWVFGKLEHFFKVNVPSDPDLQARLKQDKVVFFLHLLGIDTIGHAKRPTSQEYIENILAIDEGIAKAVKLIEDFYGDDRTAYVFTADHGMADRGVHGDGDPQNTETPLVVWGAGVSKPRFSQQHVSKLTENSRPTPLNWHLEHLTRVDVTQADIAPLMATLIGVPIPVNSVGVLPIEYLDLPNDFKAAALLDNAREILLQYQSKEEEKHDTSIFFQPFQPLLNFKSDLDHIQRQISEGKFDQALIDTEKMIKLALEGLRYYQIYDKWFLLSIVIAGYLGFMAFTTTMVLIQYTEIGSTYTGPTSSKWATLLGSLLCACMAVYLTIVSAPVMYYLYAIFPFAFWTFVLNYYGLWLHAFQKIKNNFSHPQATPIRDAAIVLGSFALVHVVVYGFYHRAIFAVCFWALALWGLFVEKRLPVPLKLGFSSMSLICSVFPLIPVDMGDMTGLLIASGIGVGFIGLYLCQNLKYDFNYGLEVHKKQHQGILPSVYEHQIRLGRDITKKILARNWLQILLVFISTINVKLTEDSLKSAMGLPLPNQVTSWAVLALSLSIMVIWPGKSFVDILINVFLSTISPMILLSINFEVLFVATFFLFCLIWIVVERFLYLIELPDNSSQLSQNDSEGQHVSLQNVRVAAIYILCCFFAFFGTGNLAGFSGFELSSAFRFQTLFDPFLMGAIVIVKIFLPFVLLCAVFGILNRQMNVSHQIASFLVVSVLSDSMTLDFLLQVKDSGSWLEIGLSISNFAMLNFFLIFQMILAGLTGLLLRGIRTERPTVVKPKLD